MTDDDDFVRITLRIPRALHEKLTTSAAKKRSMNAEIIARLEDSFALAEREVEENKIREETILKETYRSAQNEARIATMQMENVLRRLSTIEDLMRKSGIKPKDPN